MSQKKEERWSRDDTLYFIGVFKQYPELYLPSHPDFKNPEKKRLAIERIRTEMSLMKEGITYEDVRTKMRTLRHQVIVERKRQKARHGKTPTLWCFDDLAFLFNIEYRTGGTESNECNTDQFNNGRLSSCDNSNSSLPQPETIEIGSDDEEEYLPKNQEKTCSNDLKSQRNNEMTGNNVSRISQRAKQSLKNFEMNESTLEQNEKENGANSDNSSINEMQRDGYFKEEDNNNDSNGALKWQNESGQKPGSGHRVRNILTLQERVRAIQAYDRKPMYTKVAHMFNCSWEQIKNIISNRKAIMDFYEATKNGGPSISPDQEMIRQRKITFLGECMYEYLQRVQYHASATINEEMIRMKANEFRDLMQIENFFPNKAWLNHFKTTYNISLSQGYFVLTRAPPASLDLKDIMTYCSRNPQSLEAQQDSTANKNLHNVSATVSTNSPNNTTADELKQRRLRKINFLGKALYEYIQRSQYHQKTPLDEDVLLQVACELKDMLKIDNFYPNKNWFLQFKTQYDFCTTQRAIVFTRTPPLSLDLKDILSYCSRMDQKNVKVNATPFKHTAQDDHKELKRKTIEQSETVAQKPQLMVYQSIVQSEIITPTHIKDVDEDIKPNISEIKIEHQEPASGSDDNLQSPPLKIQKIETLHEHVSNTLNSFPNHSSNQRNTNNTDELWSDDLPKTVKNYSDALKLLKPLEEFAMLEENFRAIGLISQLEDIFKNTPKK